MKRCIIICLLLMTVSLFYVGVSAEKVKAAGISNLQEGKEYSFNLDKKGKKEKISYTLSKKGVFKVTVNGQTVKKIRLGEDYYNPNMQVFDIDKSDGKMDIWVYAYADSEDIRYSALYQYSNQKLSRIWNLTEDYDYEKAYSRGCGFIQSTDGKGKFTVVMDRAVQIDYLTGNHFDKVVFRLSGGKVTQVSDKIFSFYKTYGSNLGKYLITAGKLVFYKNHKKNGGTFTVKKGAKCTPKKMYIASDSQIYVKYQFTDGKTGWLCTDDWKDFSNLPFENMVFAD